MAERAKITELGRLFASAARAHHDATGGTNEEWAAWYARRLEGEIDSHVGYSPSVAEIAEWLTMAHEKHRVEAPDQRWPSYYAELILDLVEDGQATP
jgi:hypothetical protein